MLTQQKTLRRFVCRCGLACEQFLAPGETGRCLDCRERDRRSLSRRPIAGRQPVIGRPLPERGDSDVAMRMEELAFELAGETKWDRDNARGADW